MIIEDIKLTAQQEIEWLHTRTAFNWQAPGWCHILVSMLNPRQTDEVVYYSRQIERVDTDGRIIVVNPDWFFKLKLKERVAALAHCVDHAVRMHLVQSWRLSTIGHVVVSAKKTIPFIKEIADAAQDCVVNADLKVGKIGMVPDDWLQLDDITSEDSWLTAYEKLYDICEGIAKNLTQLGIKLDTHSDPGASENKPPEEASKEREENDIRWKNAVAQAAAITREMGEYGSGAGDQLKFFEEMLEPKVTWTDEIAAEFSRMPGAGGYDYMKPDEELIIRGIFAPSRSGYGCGTVVVIMDSSGSIYGVKGLIDRFFGELSGILTDVKPKRIVVIWCDAHVQSTFVIEDEMDLAACYYEGAKGGGGTDFRPPFKWLQKQEIDDIDMAVYLTDGDGDFPSEPPPFPLIWGDISHYPAKYPSWARVVQIPNDGTA